MRVRRVRVRWQTLLDRVAAQKADYTESMRLYTLTRFGKGAAPTGDGATMVSGCEEDGGGHEAEAGEGEVEDGGEGVWAEADADAEPVAEGDVEQEAGVDPATAEEEWGAAEGGSHGADGSSGDGVEEEDTELKKASDVCLCALCCVVGVHECVRARVGCVWWFVPRWA